MLEQLRIWRYQVMESRGENSPSAANQQESLSTHEKKCWFLAGLIEGEGSLCVSIKKHESFKFGYLVQPEFFIYQHQVRRGLLELAKEVFETGNIRPKPGNEVVLVYSIINRRLILERVLPFFERYMAFSFKGRDFQLFREVVMAMEQKRHRDPHELVKLVENAYQMNMGGKQRRRSKGEIVERILRDYTPNPLAQSGEDIVRS
jgi:LAGLIDADG endonuclease